MFLVVFGYILALIYSVMTVLMTFVHTFSAPAELPHASRLATKRAFFEERAENFKVIGDDRSDL